jgi:hypothetical protein
VLTQIPTATEAIGVLLVVAGVALHQERPLDATAERSAGEPPAVAASDPPRTAGPRG